MRAATRAAVDQMQAFRDGAGPNIGLHLDTNFNFRMEGFLRMASLCDAFEINVATHNYSGPIGSIITVVYCGILPNFRVMEIDVDQVPWAYDLLTVKPIIENGYISLLSGPGWGTEVNEEAVKAHPPVQENSGLV